MAREKDKEGAALSSPLFETLISFFLFIPLNRRGGFLAFLDLKSHLPLFRLIRFKFFPSIKWFLPSDLSFLFDFFYFLIFLSSTCYDVWLFVGFYVGDSKSL